MICEYLSGLYQLNLAPENIRIIERGGNISSEGQLHLYLIGRNRAGWTVPGEKVTVEYKTGDAIAVSFPPSARPDLSDFHYYYLCHSPDGTPKGAIAIAVWRNYLIDQVTPRQLGPIVLSRDEHLSAATRTQCLPTGQDLIEGMVRLLENPSGYYQYWPSEVLPADGENILEPVLGEKWVKIGSPYLGVVLSPFSSGGCAADVRTVPPVGVLPTPPYNSDNPAPVQGTPVKIALRNDMRSPVPLGTPIGLRIRINGAISDELFDEKLVIRRLGYLNPTDGTVDRTGIDEGQHIWNYEEQRLQMALPKELPPGWCDVWEISPYYTTRQMGGKLVAGTKVSFFLSPYEQAGSFIGAMWYVIGDCVLPEGDRLRVLPGIGLSLKMGSGMGVVKKYLFTMRPERTLYGLARAVENQVVAIDGNGKASCYINESVIPTSERVRAKVGCNVGFSQPSQHQITLDKPGGLDITLTYPCNNEQEGIIREDYPDVVAGAIAHFNPLYVQIWVKGSQLYKLPLALIAPGHTQQFTLSSLLEPIGEAIPEGMPCLFESPAIGCASIPGTLPTGTYTLYAAYYFDGGQATTISHKVEDGCIRERDTPA